jgi:hypothetical protein
MWQDLAAVTPPLIVCLAFLIGVGVFLHYQMSAKRRPDDDEQQQSGDDQSRNIR